MWMAVPYGISWALNVFLPLFMSLESFPMQSWRFQARPAPILETFMLWFFIIRYLPSNLFCYIDCFCNWIYEPCPSVKHSIMAVPGSRYCVIGSVSKEWEDRLPHFVLLLLYLEKRINVFLSLAFSCSLVSLCRHVFWYLPRARVTNPQATAHY